jgi:prolipoprotein diacylglyceryl transferase
VSEMPAAIPSPPSGTVSLGPLSLNVYGLMIALGVVAAVALAGRRLERREGGTRDDMSAIAVWAVAAGVVGARLYHVVTSFEKYRSNPGDALFIWRGGLGIPGGLFAGVLVGLYAVHRRGLDRSIVLAASAPAIALAQSIGRWGNWWNQELFGGPTDLPWALEIAPEKLPDGMTIGTTFHPTFLYESVWNLMLCLALLLVDRRRNMTGGGLFAMYVLGYGVGRFWIEGLRIDPTTEFGPWRLNQWMAVLSAAAAAIWLFCFRHHLRTSTGAAGFVSHADTESAMA